MWKIVAIACVLINQPNAPYLYKCNIEETAFQFPDEKECQFFVSDIRPRVEAFRDVYLWCRSPEAK